MNANLTAPVQSEGLPPALPGCTCEACDPIRVDFVDGHFQSANMRMIVCATCGNKRCPHATDHRNACTGSNEPGQKGSSWEHYRLPQLSRAFKAGDVLRVKYPFLRCEVDVPDPDPEGKGFATIQSWKPGVEHVPKPPYGEDVETICHAEGEMVLTVIDVHRPGKFPARVFFTRRWVSPDGNEFGKGGLHIMTAQAFRRRATCYMHEYTVTPAVPPEGQSRLRPSDEKNSDP